MSNKDIEQLQKALVDYVNQLLASHYPDHQQAAEIFTKFEQLAIDEKKALLATSYLELSVCSKHAKKNSKLPQVQLDNFLISLQEEFALNPKLLEAKNSQGEQLVNNYFNQLIAIRHMYADLLVASILTEGSLKGTIETELTNLKQNLAEQNQLSINGIYQAVESAKNRVNQAITTESTKQPWWRLSVGKLLDKLQGLLNLNASISKRIEWLALDEKKIDNTEVKKVLTTPEESLGDEENFLFNNISNKLKLVQEGDNLSKSSSVSGTNLPPTEPTERLEKKSSRTMDVGSGAPADIAKVKDKIAVHSQALQELQEKIDSLQIDINQLQQETEAKKYQLARAEVAELEQAARDKIEIARKLAIEERKKLNPYLKEVSSSANEIIKAKQAGESKRKDLMVFFKRGLKDNLPRGLKTLEKHTDSAKSNLDIVTKDASIVEGVMDEDKIKQAFEESEQAVQILASETERVLQEVENAEAIKELNEKIALMKRELTTLTQKAEKEQQALQEANNSLKQQEQEFNQPRPTGGPKLSLNIPSFNNNASNLSNPTKAPVTGESLLNNASNITEEQKEAVSKLGELAEAIKNHAVFKKMADNLNRVEDQIQDEQQTSEELEFEELKQADQLLVKIDAYLKDANGVLERLKQVDKTAFDYIKEILSTRNKIDEILGIPPKVELSMADVFKAIGKGDYNLQKTETNPTSSLSQKDLLVQELKQVLQNRKVAQSENTTIEEDSNQENQPAVPRI